MYVEIPVSDLKAEVHRKNSTASSESEEPRHDDDVAIQFVIPSLHNRERKLRKTRQARTKVDPSVPNSSTNEKEITIVSRLDPQGKVNQTYKYTNCILCILGSTDSQEKDSELVLQQRPSLQSVESEQGSSTNVESTGRRHSNFTNSSLNFLPMAIQTEIKPTGSLELGKLVFKN